MNNISKIFKLSVLFLACTLAIGVHALTARKVGHNNKSIGGRWLTPDKVIMNKNPKMMEENKYKKSRFRPDDIRENMSSVAYVVFV